MKSLKSVLSDIIQIGIVTDDITKVKSHMKQTFGMEPVAEKEGVFPADAYPIANPEYKGGHSEFKAYIAHYPFGQMELEFIQPLEGQSAWQDWLDEKGPSIHHIRFNVEDFKKADQLIQAHGYERVQFGDTIRGLDQPFAYYDFGPLGFHIEIMEGRTRLK